MKQNSKLRGMIRWVSVEIGLLILSLAFEMSFFFSRIIDEPWRLVMMLEANPNGYWGYIRGTFLLLILPPAVGFVVSIIGYLREEKSPTGVLELWLPLMVFGAFFFLWGILWLRWLNTSYYDALHEAEVSSSLDLAAPILAIHVTASVGAILWLFAGTLFILSPILNCC